jgi:LPXTG-motif cell wall-anchored protein
MSPPRLSRAGGSIRPAFMLLMMFAALLFSSTHAQAATPSTTDDLYATRPALTGTVSSISDRLVIVDTEQGESYSVAVDGRTVMPAGLATGMPVRIEFGRTENGVAHAQRVVPMRSGMTPSRELAYTHIGDDAATAARYASTASGDDPRDGRSHVTSSTLVASTQATPSTLAYRLATEPWIIGDVVSVNDHELVVDNDRGEQVTLAMDSHTLVPTDLAPGMPMRVEFKTMKDGTTYARRIVPMRDMAATDREMASAEVEENEDQTPTEAAETSATDEGHYMLASATDGTPAAEVKEEAAEHELATTSGEDSERLPQTASEMPLLALLAGLALAGAGATAFVRRHVQS